MTALDDATAARSARPRRRGRTGQPAAYDFRRPPIQLSREHARILHLGFEAYARQAQSAFTSALRTLCQVSLVSIDQESYAEYVESLETSTCMTIFSADPIHGAAVLELPLPVAMTCIDLMLGGPGAPDQPDRALTEIEASVLRGLVERLLGELRYSLSSVVTVKPSVVGMEYRPMFAQIAGAADAMVVVALELRLGEPSYRFTIALPFSGLLPHLVHAVGRAAVPDRDQAQRQRSSEQVREQFQNVPLDVSVRMRSTRLSPAEISGLQVGDVIRLSHPAAVPLDVTVDGATFAHATAGSRGQRLAALIVTMSDRSMPDKEIR